MILANPVFSAIMWVLFGAISAFLARGRGKNPYLWFFLGMFFGIFGVLFLAFGNRRKKRSNAKEEPTIDITPQFEPHYAPGNPNKFWYFLGPENEQKGPISFEALIRAHQEGKILDTTYVWNEGFEDWKPFSAFKKKN